MIDMTGEALGTDADKLLDSLVTFMNRIVFPGKIPPGVCPSFFGATLMALTNLTTESDPLQWE